MSDDFATKLHLQMDFVFLCTGIFVNILVIISLSVILLFLTTFSGYVILKFNKSLTGKKMFLLVSFSAGTLVAIASHHFFEVIKVSSKISEIITLFFAGILLNVFISFLFKKRKWDENKKLVWMLLPADMLHNLTESFVLVNALLIDVFFGFWALFTLILHEIPHKTANFGLLLFSLNNQKNAFFLSVLSGLFFIPGAIFAYSGHQSLINNELIQAFISGNFVYVSLGAVLPKLFKSSSFKDIKSETISFFLGILIILLISILK